MVVKDATEERQAMAFMLASMVDGNSSVPNYDLVDGIPDFSKSNWSLLNPLSYLLQDIDGLRKVAKEAFQNLLDRHVASGHGMAGARIDVSQSLLRRDFANLVTPDIPGRPTVSTVDAGGVKMLSNGTIECSVAYSFDSKANQPI